MAKDLIVDYHTSQGSFSSTSGNTCQNRLRQASRSPAKSTSKPRVFGEYSGVDGTQLHIRDILEKICNHEQCACLVTRIRLKILADFSKQALSWKRFDQEFSHHSDSFSGICEFHEGKFCLGGTSRVSESV